MALNAIHLLALLDTDIDAACVPKQVKQAFRPIILAWRALPEEKRRRIAMRMERCARMSFSKPDPYLDEDLSDVEGEF